MSETTGETTHGTSIQCDTGIVRDRAGLVTRRPALCADGSANFCAREAAALKNMF